MPVPINISQLDFFLGLVSHYTSFLSKRHHIRSPLNNFLKKDFRWNWSPEYQIKSLLASDILLTHYKPFLGIIVVLDTSGYVNGAVITLIFPNDSQKAIAHAGRSLTPAERNYGKIEKEAMVIMFAIKKFYKILYGRKYNLVTDHRLLANFLIKKSIPILAIWYMVVIVFSEEMYSCTRVLFPR